MSASIEVASQVNPFQKDIPEGVVIPAVDAVNWSIGRNVDIRPRLYDKASGQFRLVDSGSMITATARKPHDKPDDSFNLVAVNGSRIKTYGTREITIKIGRKAYHMPAIVCDIGQDILGMDFLTKYKLGFEWDEATQSELFITDRKADIKEILQFVTVPNDLQRTSYLETSHGASSSPQANRSWVGALEGVSPLTKSNEAIVFEMACVEQLDLKSEEEKEKENSDIEKALQQHAEEYVKLIRKYPSLLKPSFSKGVPAHGVYHKIETADHAPCRAKRRPIATNSTKSEQGRKAWEKMEKDGVIERVKADSNTDWTNCLHLAPKPGGGVRPCTDFRQLNKKTVVDAYPLPLLKNFTSKIHGAKLFSRVDLRAAFFNVPVWPAHRHKTTTLSPWGGAFVYNRLPFGLASAPATWQKLLDTVLKDIPNSFVYLDDVLVWGRTKEEHHEVLEKVFKRLSENNMALSLEKCIFGQEQVEYLGYNVSPSGIRPLQRKLDALADFQEPKSQKDVLHFCGALNYFRSSLKGIKTESGYKSAAAVLQPLYTVGTDKMPAGTKFQDVWGSGPALKNAFKEAKQMLQEAVELTHPNPN